MNKSTQLIARLNRIVKGKHWNIWQGYFFEEEDDITVRYIRYPNYYSSIRTPWTKRKARHKYKHIPSRVPEFVDDLPF